MSRIALCTAAFLSLANSLCAEDHLHYQFTNPANFADAERDVSISFDVSRRDDSSYSAVYSHREQIGNTLNDEKTVNFERSLVLTIAEAGAFFSSLADAGLWKLPDGDNFIGNGPNSQLYATISGRDLQRIYNSPIDGAAREAFHAAVTAFAKKLGIDQPEDVAKATQTIEGDRTPAREIPFHRSLPTRRATMANASRWLAFTTVSLNVAHWSPKSLTGMALILIASFGSMGRQNLPRTPMCVGRTTRGCGSRACSAPGTAGIWARLLGRLAA